MLCSLISMISTFIPLKDSAEGVLVPLSCYHHENKLLLEELKGKHLLCTAFKFTLHQIQELLKSLLLPGKKNKKKSWSNWCHPFLVSLVKKCHRFLNK